MGLLDPVATVPYLLRVTQLASRGFATGAAVQDTARNMCRSTARCLFLINATCTANSASLESLPVCARFQAACTNLSISIVEADQAAMLIREGSGIKL